MRGRLALTNRRAQRRTWRRPDRRGYVGAYGASAPGPVTFPTTALATRVRVALGADLSADPLTWPWVDITSKVRFDLGISTSVGRRDEASTVTRGSGQMKLDNRDGRFTRRNPLGPYFGLLSKNTPIWGEVDAGSGWKTRMEMFVNEWPKSWADKSANDSTVTIGCAGVLRRLAQGQVFKSPLRRVYLSQAQPQLAAYWPCEDEEGSLSVGSGLPSGAPLTGLTPHFGSDIPGSTGTLDLTALDPSPAFLSATATLPSSSGFQFEFSMICNSGALTPMFAIASGTFSGFTLLSAASTDGVPHHFAVRYVQNGANFDVISYRDGVFSTTQSIPGTLGSSVSLYIYANSQSSIVQLAHMAIYGFSTMDLPTSRAPAVDGYAGEMAHVRIARLCGEEGVTYESAAGTSSAMGVQGTSTLVSLLRECEAADMGVLYEKRWGLAYQSLAERYNAPVGLALDLNAGHIADVPEPADDDQRVRNRWTVSRSGGSEYTAEETSGPMGTGAQGPGLYDDSATVNVETDSQLAGQAGWRVHLGTVDEDRWPSLGLNFDRSPSLIDSWCSLGYGARLTVANPIPQQMPPDPPDLIVEGYDERWDPKLWTASLNCSPASPYRVNVVGSTDGNLGRVDAANSYLAADATSGASTISVASPGALWRTGAVNFDINVAGERMTVTNIAGGSSPQTFTVTRAVNGVSKAQPATVGGFSTKVSLWQPSVYAL